MVGVLAIAMAPAILPWSGSSRSMWVLISDKWLHAFTFAFLALWYSGQYTRQSYGWIAGGLLLFGALIEFCQSLVTYRTAEAMDLMADGIGIAAGMMVALLGFGGWSLRTERWMQQKLG